MQLPLMWLRGPLGPVSTLLLLTAVVFCASGKCFAFRGFYCADFVCLGCLWSRWRPLFRRNLLTVSFSFVRVDHQRRPVQEGGRECFLATLCCLSVVVILLACLVQKQLAAGRWKLVGRCRVVVVVVVSGCVVTSWSFSSSRTHLGGCMVTVVEVLVIDAGGVYRLAFCALISLAAKSVWTSCCWWNVLSLHFRFWSVAYSKTFIS